MIVSMSRKADPWDNAPREPLFSTLKSELIYRERFVNRENAKMKIVDYIEMFYNSVLCLGLRRKRPHSSLGYQSFLDFERTENLS